MDKKNNTVEFGIKKAHVHWHNLEEDTFKLEAGVHIKGMVGFTPSADGNSTPFYADDIEYYTANSNNGYSADLNIASIPDAILARMLGWKISDDGGLVEVSDGIPEPFALSFEGDGDVHKTRHIYYNCQANRPAKALETKTDNITVNPETLPIKIKPIQIDGLLIVKQKLAPTEANKANYDKFFTDPVLPTFEVDETQTNALKTTQTKKVDIQK